MVAVTAVIDGEPTGPGQNAASIAPQAGFNSVAHMPGNSVKRDDWAQIGMKFSLGNLTRMWIFKTVLSQALSLQLR